jgi:hypothetical protein
MLVSVDYIKMRGLIYVFYSPLVFLTSEIITGQVRSTYCILELERLPRSLKKLTQHLWSASKSEKST